MIDENGNIEIVIVENSGKILQSFILKAKRKRLRRLKDIGAYNVIYGFVGGVVVVGANQSSCQTQLSLSCVRLF